MQLQISLIIHILSYRQCIGNIQGEWCLLETEKYTQLAIKRTLLQSNPGPDCVFAVDFLCDNDFC